MVSPSLSRSESEPVVSRIVTPCYVNRGRRVVKAGNVLPSIEHTLNARRQTLVKLHPNVTDVELNPWESRGKVPWAKLRIEPRLCPAGASDCLSPLSPIEAHALERRKKVRSVPLQHLRHMGWQSAPHLATSTNSVWEDRIQQILGSTNDPSKSSCVQLLTHLSQRQAQAGVGTLKVALEFLEGSLENSFLRMQRLGCQDGLRYHHFVGALTFLGLDCSLLTGCDAHTLFHRLTTEDCLSQREFVAKLRDPLFASRDKAPMTDAIDVLVRYAALRARRRTPRAADGLPDPPTESEWKAEEVRLQEVFHSMKRDPLQDATKDEFISFWGPAMVENATHWFALTLTQSCAREGCVSSCSFAETWNQGTNDGCVDSVAASSCAGRFTANRMSDDTWKATWKNPVSHAPTTASSMFGKKESRRLHTTEELMFTPNTKKVSFEAFKEIVPQICFDICGLHFGLSELDL